MLGLLLKWFLNTLALFAVVHLLKGIHSDSWQTTATAALVFGLVNAFLKPLVILFTLPLTILSLGLFTLIINGFMLYLVSKIVEGFYITDFWYAFWGAAFFSIFSALLNLFINPSGKFRFRNFASGDSRYRPADNEIIDVEHKRED
ncbi:MAG: phage holin family protein [Candidatus Omnitrophota bacterium]|jgi:putative membrane protein|nr:MAG: phage holin family protein [Candidatus Omnitrophota bacterium]